MGWPSSIGTYVSIDGQALLAYKVGPFCLTPKRTRADAYRPLVSRAHGGACEVWRKGRVVPLGGLLVVWEGSKLKAE